MVYYPLTAPQQNIWNLQKYYEHTAIGNIAGMITFARDCPPDMLSLLDRAVNRLIETSDSLRIRLEDHAGTVRQYFCDYTYEAIPVRNRPAWASGEIAKELEQEAQTPLPLIGQPLYRFSIIRQENQYALFIVIHHIICDGWSINLMADRVAGYIRSADPDLPEPSYIRFLEEEDRYCQGRRFVRDAAYWETFARDFSGPSLIKPLMPGSDCVRAARYTDTLSRTQTQHIHAYCAANGLSPDTLYKTAFAVYLHALNHVPAVVIGSPVLSRDGAAAKNTVGMYVSTLPAVIRVDETASVRSHLMQCADNARAIFRHSKYPYSRILAETRHCHGENCRLFDVMISYEPSSIRDPSITAVRWFFQGYAENALTVHIDDRNSDHCLDITYDYQLHLFRTEAEAALFAGRIRFIIQQMIADDTQPVSGIRIIPDMEYRRIIHTFNETVSAYPRDACLHALFAAQAAKTPHKTAVVCDRRSLTYRELDHLSNNLAAHLDIRPGDVVALYMHRSEQILVTQLAVLKKGGIFLPIDLSVPAGRIEDMLSDCNARYLVISEREKTISLCGVQLRMLNIDALSLDRRRSVPAAATVTAEMGAHIIYTSGSTGKPKGSILTHRGLVNFVYHNLVINPGKCEYDNAISINTISFDMFLCETITPLVAGITVHIATEQQQTNQAAFARYVLENDIQILQTTPTRYKILTADKNNLRFLDSFKAMLLSGEPFTPEIYREMRANSHARIYNTCGPSENHIWICGCELHSDDITLGFPVKNTQIYILDEGHRPVPIGVPGELCVSGDCIGLGYLNRPELNAEKYIPHPFRPGTLLYRTGDLAFFRPDGSIEPLGRIDTQVKIRGLRVELGEIESHICAFPGVSNAAAAVIRSEGKDFLCAFYQSGASIDQARLKETLERVLPGYMIPNLFIRVDAFPMTTSGKIARSVLGKYDISGLTASTEYSAPVTALERLICGEFQRLLGIEQVSRDLDFFTAGGNSIHVIELIARMPRMYRLSVKDVYDHPTAQQLAAFLEGKRETEYKTLSPLAHRDARRVFICFPFAGSDAATFRGLSEALNRAAPDASVFALKHANWEDIILADAVREISDIASGADALYFYSHCAGSAMALKVYRALPDRQKVRHIFIAANVPPRSVRLYGKWLNPWTLVPDQALLHILRRAGMDASAMSESACEKLTRQFRLDTGCYFREMAVPGSKAEVGCTLILGAADPFTASAEKARKLWQPYFTKPVDVQVIPGANHYFHIHQPDEVVNILADRLD